MYGPFLKTSPGMRMLESPYLKAIKKSLQKKKIQLLELNQ